MGRQIRQASFFQNLNFCKPKRVGNGMGELRKLFVVILSEWRVVWPPLLRTDSTPRVTRYLTNRPQNRTRESGRTEGGPVCSRREEPHWGSVAIFAQELSRR